MTQFPVTHLSQPGVSGHTFRMTYAAYLIAGLVVLASAHLGLTQALGAHPFWATQIAWIGVPLGLVAAFALAWLRNSIRLAFFAAALVTTGFAAHFGKTEFAASFAENQLAGQIWHFGWIATVASATALIATVLSARRQA